MDIKFSLTPFIFKIISFKIVVRATATTPLIWYTTPSQMIVFIAIKMNVYVPQL
jgi:hypothetical protein